MRRTILRVDVAKYERNSLQATDQEEEIIISISILILHIYQIHDKRNITVKLKQNTVNLEITQYYLKKET